MSAQTTIAEDRGISTPSPVPTPSHPWSLSERINVATRPTHSQLNRLITARLPLALPPCTSNPTAYLTGILHIAPIYITFESLWQSMLDAPHIPTSLDQAYTFDACDPGEPKLDIHSISIPSTNRNKPLLHHARVCSRTHSLLSHLHLPGLLRSGRLRADIRTLTNTPDHEVDGRLADISANGKLAGFIDHIKKSVESNPHVLVAYTWVLYMALFAGGRYLRASLQNAGPEFWSSIPNALNPYAIHRSSSARSHSRSEEGEQTSTLKPRMRRMSRSESNITKTSLGLQFFHFLGDEDGEDIKLEFKKRITEAEVLLTSGEKDDIVLEAQEIFKFMIEVVGDLDELCGTAESDDEAELDGNTRLGDDHKNPAVRIRNSVFVTQERLCRKKNALAPPSPEKERRSSAWDVFMGSPAGKLVRFDLGLNLEALSRRFSRVGIGESSGSAKSTDGAGGVGRARRLSVEIGRMSVAIYFLLILSALIAWLLLD